MITRKPHHKKTPLWIFLWIVSGIILVPFFKVIFVIYNVFTILFRTYITKTRLKGTLAFYFKRMSMAEDQTANVYGFDILNDTMLKKGSPMYFGFVDETISSATGKALRRKQLSIFGEAMDSMLESFEEGHSEKSIENDEGINIK